jgi:hypothetical protein
MVLGHGCYLGCQFLVALVVGPLPQCLGHGTFFQAMDINLILKKLVEYKMQTTDMDP